MLKDRYPLNMSWPEANDFFSALYETFVHHGDTKDALIQLPLAVIQPFHERLNGKLLYPKPQIKIYLRKTEALAFHNLYMNGMIRKSIHASQVNTEIHRTL